MFCLWPQRLWKDDDHKAGERVDPAVLSGTLHGRVLVDGQEIAKLPMYQIAAKIGSVFQNPRTQFFNVDTDSEIAFGLEKCGTPTAGDCRACGTDGGRSAYSRAAAEKYL